MNADELKFEKEFAGRLVDLVGGRKGLRGQLAVKATPQEGPVIDFVASDETIDRYDEVVSAAGWKLDNYKKNPVFQNSHKYGDITFTLGRSLVTEVREAKLYQRIEFAVNVNPIAKVAFGLYKGGFLNAVSVGFIPLDWQPGEPGSNVYRKYTSQELLELSAVAVPANPNALVVGLKAGALEEADVKEAAELIRAWVRGEFRDAETASLPNNLQQTRTEPGVNERATEPGINDAHLLLSLRAFNEALGVK